MRLGTRWPVGSPAPARLPEAMLAAIRDAEDSGEAATGAHWTLTWLEGRAIVDLDGGVRLIDTGDDIERA